MEKRWHILVLAGACLIAGCVIPSLQPLAEEEDAVFDERLLGKWVAPEDPCESWTVTRGEKKAYKMVYHDDKGRVGNFVGHLVRLEGLLFLDLYPVEGDEKINVIKLLHYVGAHSFVRIDRLDTQLKIAVLNPNWLDDYLEAHPDAIEHCRADERVVLTAPPAALQAFLLAHQDTEKAFIELDPLLRQGAVEPVSIHLSDDPLTQDVFRTTPRNEPIVIEKDYTITLVEPPLTGDEAMVSIISDEQLQAYRMIIIDPGTGRPYEPTRVDKVTEALKKYWPHWPGRQRRN